MIFLVLHMNTYNATSAESIYKTRQQSRRYTGEHPIVDLPDGDVSKRVRRDGNKRIPGTRAILNLGRGGGRVGEGEGAATAGGIPGPASLRKVDS